MKNLIILMFILLFAFSCVTSKKSGGPDKKNSVQVDSTEYKITIIDTGFDTWFLKNFSPSKDHSNEFYRSKNQLGVSNWNNYFNKGQYTRVVENYIYYDFAVDYGMEVNRTLFWYFRYIEDQYRIRILH